MPQSCGAWVAAKQAANAQYPSLIARVQYEDWMGGYLSGIELTTGISALETSDVPSIDLWIDQYCAAHPLDSLAVAGTSLWRSLVARMPQ
jgi:hypothetical protein